MSKAYLSSKYTDKKVTEADYICHLVCENRARSADRELPFKFWQFDEWKQYFLYQKRVVYPLLKKYGFGCVCSVLRNNDSIFSLRNKLLVKKLDMELAKQPSISQVVEVRGTKDATSQAKQNLNNDKVKQTLDG